MLQVHIVSVVPDYIGSIALLQVVVVHLQGQLGRIGEVVGPMAKNVAAIIVLSELGGFYERGRQERFVKCFAGIALVVISLKREPVNVRRFPVEAKTATGCLPIIFTGAGIIDKVFTVEILHIGVKEKVLIALPAITDGRRGLVLGSIEDTQQSALRVFGALGDDIDDTVDGVRAPERCPWPANDLNPINIFEGHILYAPIDAPEFRCVNTAAINKH